MKRTGQDKSQDELEPQRRLSPWRVILATLIMTGLIGGGISRIWQWQAEQPMKRHGPWFAAYVDVTSMPTFAFEEIGANLNGDAILSFIVSSTNTCAPSWGGVYTLDEASISIDLDRRIARLRQQGGNVAISFGGLNNDELACKCTDPNELLEAYRSVVERYNIDTMDLDLEGNGLTDTIAGDRRAAAIAKLQSERRKKGRNLSVWVTLAVTPQGLNEDGANAVARLLANGVDLAGVNAMTMDFGSSKAPEQTMLMASESALTEVQRQLGILYKRSGGIQLNNATIWSKIGATPMIGQNDVADEIFNLADAQDLKIFALSRGVGRLSMWSANRDIACGSNYVNTKIVSDSCSGVIQNKYGFTEALGAGFYGRFSNSSGFVTTADSTSTTQTPDDPATSPYQIWSETGTYLQGTKVVWHHNVYKAKWWSRGDIPDNAVLQSWETPWKLIGPVLPSEKPIPQLTLPIGTYPKWSGDKIYNAGQRVLFNGIPYQSKWWNQGESPAAESSDPDGSPWTPLTQKQINELK